MIQKISPVLLLCLAFQTLFGQSFTNGFSFTLPPFDASRADFLPHFEKREITNFITTGPDGNFVDGDLPIRFWGVNVTTGGCFPTVVDAPLIAGRMRKMGINLVRFHHLDNPWSDNQNSIFNQNGRTTSLNPITLDRLFGFLAAMKQEGVYANMNLHVSRTFTEGDGVLHADSIPDFGKVVTMFDRQLIDLQKQYARQLLTTVNPYTGLKLVEDPVVAMVEITNENTIYGYWRSDWLQPLVEGGRLLSRHADSLDVRWQQFLRDKYSSQSALQVAWGNASGGTGNNLIRDGGFESGDLLQEWRLEEHQSAQATVQASQTNPYRGQYAAEITVSRATGTAWHIQFQQGGAALQQDSVYVVRFYARASGQQTLSAGAMRNASPWTWYGGTRFTLSTDWQEYNFTFRAPETTANLGRVTIQMGLEPGTYWIDDVNLTSGRSRGLLPGESIDAGNIRRLKYSERLGFHPQRMADQAEFYLTLQTDYYREMYHYLSTELGVRVPITGSNALGGIHEPFTHADVDYIDDHAYWDHPRFPNQPWSNTDWNINNNSMLADDFLGTVPAIFGGYQVQDKPFTISEYNHAQPNIYQAEMVPILAGYGAFHGVDGFMFFSYKDGDYLDWEDDRQDRYFALHRNTPVMALFPLFSYAYQNGLIAEDPAPLTATYSPDFVYRNIPENDNNGRWGKYHPYDQNLALTNSIRIDGFDGDRERLPEQSLVGPPYKTTTGELTFHPDRQVFTLQTPKIESIAGRLDNAPSESGSQMEILRGEKHGVITWLSLTDQPLASASRSIIALTSRFQNQNMIWNGTNTVGNNWGNAPTEVQALDIDIRLKIAADSLRIYPLDPTGKTDDGFTVYPSGPAQFDLRLDQLQSNSLWFGVEAFDITTSTESKTVEESLEVYPNPVGRGEVINISGWQQFDAYRFVSLHGQVVRRGPSRPSIPLDDLPAGIYFLEMRGSSGSVVKKVLVQFL